MNELEKLKQENSELQNELNKLKYENGNLQIELEALRDEIELIKEIPMKIIRICFVIMIICLLIRIITG